MSTTTSLGVYLAVVSAMFLSGCDAHPKPTVGSARRILALEFRPPTPPPTVTKFLSDTNNDEPDFFDGTFGGFKGSMSATSLSSNAAAWRVQIALNGSFGGSDLHQTNEIEIAFPGSQTLSLGQIGSVTGWFLSDAELLDYDKRAPK